MLGVNLDMSAPPISHPCARFWTAFSAYVPYRETESIVFFIVFRERLRCREHSAKLAGINRERPASQPVRRKAAGLNRSVDR
jgi:hypothetical protein